MDSDTHGTADANQAELSQYHQLHHGEKEEKRKRKSRENRQETDWWTGRESERQQGHDR